MECDLLQCYNRGCGQKYRSDQNNEDSCRHHPGEPFFHDAYKGWSCCKKKCTDFTEFLNIKGCTISRHSNIKPPEPEKLVEANIVPDEVTVVKPITRALKRPPYDTPMTTMQPQIAPSLKQQLMTTAIDVSEKKDSTEVVLGTTCQNGGCNTTYEGPETNNTSCVFHPGVPIFHEGLKFWSCCQKRTTDFNAFLNQVGCETGRHLWKKDSDDPTIVGCRWDFHQTGADVVISIYAKQYCPSSSIIKLNPVRLYVNLVFPQESNATFHLDIELCGIINVVASQVTMYATKVEIKLKKAEPGTWSKLETAKSVNEPVVTTKTKIEDLAPKVEGVNLDDL